MTHPRCVQADGQVAGKAVIGQHRRRSSARVAGRDAGGPRQSHPAL